MNDAINKIIDELHTNTEVSNLKSSIDKTERLIVRFKKDIKQINDCMDRKLYLVKVAEEKLAVDEEMHAKTLNRSKEILTQALEDVDYLNNKLKYFEHQMDCAQSVLYDRTEKFNKLVASLEETRKSYIHVLNAWRDVIKENKYAGADTIIELSCFETLSVPSNDVCTKLLAINYDRDFKFKRNVKSRTCCVVLGKTLQRIKADKIKQLEAELAALKAE